MLTLTEFDAIAVHQSTSYPAISLSLGANSLPIEVCRLTNAVVQTTIFFWNVSNQFCLTVCNNIDARQIFVSCLLSMLTCIGDIL